MRILELQASSFKRLRAVDITPNGHMVEIRGRNGMGKSSVLDAIEGIFASAGALPKRPVRDGAERAILRASIGEGEAVEYVVTRRITAVGGTSLVIEAPSGARYPRPQEFVDKLIGAISFDPMEFARAKPKAQFEELRRIVKLDIDADAIDGNNRRDFEARTDLNRDAARLRAQAAGIEAAANLPARPIDTAALIADMQRAGDANRLIDRTISDRQSSEEIIADGLRQAARCDAEAAELVARAEAHRKRAKDQREALDGAEPVPEPIDTAVLAESLRRAQETNSQITERDRRTTLEAEAEALERRSAALTEAMTARTQEKADALARAAFPVPGLGFGEGEILYNNVPFEQASQAEKIRVSVGVAIAANPTLRVLCVRDGSLLDSDSMRLLSELVTESDYQCWIEVTDDDGQVGFVIEDGAVKGAPEIAPEVEPRRTVREPPANVPGGVMSTAPGTVPGQPVPGKIIEHEPAPAAPEGKTVRRARPKVEQGGLL